VRADYCGDGVSHTDTGIDLLIYEGDISSDSAQPTWCPEASWDGDAARCIWSDRLAYVNGTSYPVVDPCKTNFNDHNEKYENRDHKCTNGKDLKHALLFTKYLNPSCVMTPTKKTK